MKTLIVYDSQYGNTKLIARAIEAALSQVGETRMLRVQAMRPESLEGVNLLILGSPIQGWRPTVAMQTLLQSLTAERLRGVSVACFDTRIAHPRWLAGSAAKIMVHRLQALGAVVVAPPEGFYVEGTEGPLAAGEEARAADWATALAVRVGEHELAQR
ncbi:MAG: flavodoxin-like domain-containing protein [Chloroflexota bacterium]|nr:flavodoxin-like domain-containing protein [Chloroflexota bacterium]